MSLTKVHAGVRLSELHPELRRRAEGLFAALPGLSVVSGVRTYAQQAALFKKWKAGKGNLAANPDALHRSGVRGSRHMVQPDGYAYALDIRRGQYQWSEVHRQAREFGLIFPLAKSGSWPEPWHLQANVEGSLDRWVSAPALHGRRVRTPEPQAEVAGRVQLALDFTVRRGSTGTVVVMAQDRLILGGWLPPGDGDGVFGRRTVRAVRRLQRFAGLVVDGVVGVDTWKVLMRQPPPQCPRPKLCKVVV